MLSKLKVSHFAAAATLAVLMGMPAVPDLAAAQDREARREMRQDRSDAREQRDARRDTRQERREARSDRNDDRSRIATRDRSHDRSRIVIRNHRDRDWDRRWAYRSYAQGAAFVVLGPRVVYRDYGPNWCRGLHRGRHFDRRVGWHAGRHYGPFRC